MLAGFQKYLVDKGFTRWCFPHLGKKNDEEVENYDSVFLSTYCPLIYTFKKGNKQCWWGLSECDKPPVMFLGYDKINLLQLSSKEAAQNNIKWFKERTVEDGYRIILQQIKDYDLIYDVFMSDDLIFNVYCTVENPFVIITSNYFNFNYEKD
jgi:hypothetical protein